MKTKYETLVHILDKLNSEAPQKYKKYHAIDAEGKNHARALSLIHLFLKSKFGLMTFSDRIKWVTDDSGDGGIDAYFVEETTKTIHVIQSKFRASDSNFSEKAISPDELSSIDLGRILKGEDHNEDGERYNGKIIQFQQVIDGIPDIGRWKYKVIIIANVAGMKPATIRRLVGGFEYEIFDHNRVYLEIILPICSGQYFDPESITLEIETNDGNRIEVSQSIATTYGGFQVRLIFVPAIELAKNVVKYKNSLMKYNPRNFLSFSTNKVNSGIKESIIGRTDNFFALLNNGVTFVAATDSFTDRAGKKGIGKLTLTRPQIINGGQTAYALGTIYEDEKARKYLDGKSVLVKVITSEDAESIDIEVVEKISYANNRQSKIVEADQRSNSRKLLDVQTYFFSQHHLFFERKRGEFYEGISEKYIDKSAVINRVDFLKSAVAYSGNPSKSRSSQESLFEEDAFDSVLENLTSSQMALAYLARIAIKAEHSLIGISPFPLIAAISTSTKKKNFSNLEITKIIDSLPNMKQSWMKFESWAAKKTENRVYLLGAKLGDNYQKGSTIDEDIAKYFLANPLTLNI